VPLRTWTGFQTSVAPNILAYGPPPGQNVVFYWYIASQHQLETTGFHIKYHHAQLWGYASQRVTSNWTCLSFALISMQPRGGRRECGLQLPLMGLEVCGVCFVICTCDTGRSGLLEHKFFVVIARRAGITADLRKVWRMDNTAQCLLRSNASNTAEHSCAFLVVRSKHMSLGNVGQGTTSSLLHDSPPSRWQPLCVPGSDSRFCAAAATNEQLSIDQQESHPTDFVAR